MMAWRRTGLLVVAAVAALVVHAVAKGGSAPRVSASVTVTSAPVTRAVGPGFLGLALEYSTIPAWVGSGRGKVNPPLVQLIRNLEPDGQALVRIGGQSSDRAWWPVPGIRQPLGVTYTLSSAWVSAARALAKAVDARLMLGLNLEADQPRIARQEATQLLSGLGASTVQSFALGNEPELYTSTPWYRIIDGKPAPWYAKGGTRVHARPPSWSPSAFGADFSRFAADLPNVPLAGPESGNPAWVRSFLHFVSPHSKVRTVTLHGYGTNGCFTNPSDPGYASIGHMLSLHASRALLGSAGAVPRIVHRDGATFRMDELGSVSCNGKAGVSDTMASALWVMDALFSLARSGVDGVNLHSFPNSLNGLFDFKLSHGRWHATVHPLYYGALMFARAAPPGSRLLRVLGHAGDSLRMWATLGADHLVRVLLINDSQSAVTTVTLRAPSGYGSSAASVQQLRARSAAAQSGITIGGRGFGDTTTGALAPPVAQSVAPRSGVYSVTVPASSATLLTLSPSS